MRVLLSVMLVCSIEMSTLLQPGAYAKSVEAGDASSSWIGIGELHELGNGKQVIIGMMEGVLSTRHKDEGQSIVHASKLVCPVRVNLRKKKDYQAIDGHCLIIAHEGKDIAFAQWECRGNVKECDGQFTFTGGEGGFEGMSGTTPFHMGIILELQEGHNAQAIAYAVWPHLTYTLP